MLCNGLFYKDKNDSSHIGYFCDSWNILDFIIIITSFIEFLPLETQMSNLTAIRVLRVLRPLRTITKFKKLKILISTLIESLSGLAEVMLLTLFLFILFSIFGVHLWLNNELHFIN
eukprot:242101_1